MDYKRAVKILLIISIVAFLVRIYLFAWAMQQHAVGVYEYEYVAENMLQGKGFTLNHLGTTYKAAIAPLYPFISFFLYFLLGHHYVWVVLLQIILSTAICYVVFRIATLLCDARVGLCAAALVAFHPGLIVYSSMKLHALMLYSFFICIIVLKHLKIARYDSLRNRLVLGLLWGLCLLERPTVLVFLLPAVVWHYVVTRNMKKTLGMALTICAASFIITFPWLMRSQNIYKHFVFIQSNQWQGLWLGNNPMASGSAHLSDGRTMLDANPEMLWQLIGLGEQDQMNIFKSASCKFIKENLARFLILTAKKFYYFWWFSPQAGILYPKAWLNIYRIFYCLLILFAVIGSVRFLREPRLRSFWILVFSFFIFYSLVHSFYYFEVRHRWSIEPLMIIFSSAGICSVWDRLMRHYHQRANARI